MSQVKRSQLVVGQDYYLGSTYNTKMSYPATFKGRSVDSIYFECNVRHPYMETTVEQFKGCLAFIDSDELNGFYPVK
jgi:hypothetical protein